MKILIRVDSSREIGTGHTMRCLSLAIGLKEKCAEITFLSRDATGILVDLVRKQGFEVLVLPPGSGKKFHYEVAHSRWLGVSQKIDARESIAAAGSDWDLVVVDHYGISSTWENEIRTHTKKILVIDDIADREHNCDFLVDQNLYNNATSRYDGKISSGAKLLLGPKFALLRHEFRLARNKLSRKNGLKKILVFYGGADPANETQKALDGLLALKKGAIGVTVVCGPSNPHLGGLEKFCAKHSGFHLLHSVSNMAELMMDADLSLGGGGTTTWERCALGLPAIVTIMAENQREMAMAAEGAGVQIVAGDTSRVSSEMLGGLVAKFSENPELLAAMTKSALCLVDGLGVTRVIQEVSK